VWSAPDTGPEHRRTLERAHRRDALATPKRQLSSALHVPAPDRARAVIGGAAWTAHAALRLARWKPTPPHHLTYERLVALAPPARALGQDA
jgi:hypothetical protein